MPDLDGIEATRRIMADDALAGVKVLVLTTFETDELVVAALRAGASRFLGKGVAPGALLDAIRTVVAGDQLLSPAATWALIERVLTRPDLASWQDTPGMAELTDREREVAQLVGRGLSNAEIGEIGEIAERLYISPSTAKIHVNRAMMKTGARARAQLVVLAYETGLISPGGE
jgi:DNA-binding NarL/FixJ family response regulator